MSKARPRLVHMGKENEAYWHNSTYYPVRLHGAAIETAHLAALADAPPLPHWLSEQLDDSGNAAFVASDGRRWAYPDGDAHPSARAVSWHNPAGIAEGVPLAKLASTATTYGGGRMITEEIETESCWLSSQLLAPARWQVDDRTRGYSLLHTYQSYVLSEIRARGLQTDVGLNTLRQYAARFPVYPDSELPYWYSRERLAELEGAITVEENDDYVTLTSEISGLSYTSPKDRQQHHSYLAEIRESLRENNRQRLELHGALGVPQSATAEQRRIIERDLAGEVSHPAPKPDDDSYIVTVEGNAIVYKSLISGYYRVVSAVNVPLYLNLRREAELNVVAHNREALKQLAARGLPCDTVASAAESYKKRYGDPFKRRIKTNHSQYKA